ncbi:hypothetical protein CP97_00980 [Aurantiacibacter atlanticus]|uniref:Uncharacterized protein n=1 Tax=Aurantiacibacter atlanticus TaxID=1648404 RepID=A0A0H4VDI2_9SPHN|nr:hypothetical protein [Aurantiacibacter atlanticus]AKQ40926.1 hypothetical protein CP97_00980 [Aurantiacibacter atlanticus]MDF1834289.1 hypothetical protein [Alteraurantiacibacter sp. bin_em_oilr2.035]
MSWDDYFADDAEGAEAEKRGRNRSLTVGWTVRWPGVGDTIWAPPKTFTRSDAKAASAKSIQACPAAIDFDRRHFVVPCPVDLELAFTRNAQGQLQLTDANGEQSAMRPQGRANLFQLQPPGEWRHPERPILQFTAPYVFVADQPCYVVQTAPYLHWFPTPRPGVEMGGRFPIHIWPRPLAWAFEWYDISKPLILKRGEPWFYVSFETENPSARVRLVEQEMTKDLETYLNSIIDVSNYVNKTYGLFGEAQRRRPEKLVKPKG